MNLELRHGAFSYETGPIIFKKLSFSLKTGEILSILGTNGCGKTTLLKCLAGILDFSEGSLILDDSPCKTQMDRSGYFGYVPQLTTAPLSYSVFQMVLLGRSRYIGTFSKPSELDKEKTTETIKLLQIEHLSDRPFSSLSGGERQLVLIARALTTEAKILLFDEPTSALDLVNQQNTVELMRLLAQEHGLSLIFSTHAPSHALHISDRTLLLSRGENALYGKAEEVITEENMHKNFGIETKIIEFNHNDAGTSLSVVPVLKPFYRRSKVYQ